MYLGTLATVFGYTKNCNQDNFRLNHFGTECNLAGLGTIVTELSRFVGTVKKLAHESIYIYYRTDSK